jgi:hypothetical protein
MSAKNDQRVGPTNYLSDRVFSDEESLQINELTGLEAEFLSCLDRLAKQKGNNTRCLSLARTNMQQARMWAVEEILTSSTG